MSEDLLIEEPLVQGPELILTPKYRTKLHVKTGTAAVITRDGAPIQTLWPGRNLLPGGYWLIWNMPFAKLEVYTIDVRNRVMTVEEDLIIQDKNIPVRLGIAVTYKVVQPYRVLDNNDPLEQLRIDVAEAMRETVNCLEYTEFLMGGQAADDILDYLKSDDLEEYLGLQVIDVQISKLDAKEIEFETEMRQRKAKADNISYKEILIDHPELYAKLLDTWIRLIQSGFDPTTLSGGNAELKGQFMQMFGAVSNEKTSPPNIPNPDRITTDCRILHEQGYDVDPRIGKEVPNPYYVYINTQNSLHIPLTLYLLCPPNYPYEAPQVLVEFDGQQRDFNSETVENWSPQNTLLDIVNEAHNFFGLYLEAG